MRGLVLTIERRATAVQRAGVRGLGNRVDGPVHDDEGREAALEQGAHVPTHKLCQHPRPWSLSALHHFPHPSCAQRSSPVLNLNLIFPPALEGRPKQFMDVLT
jgi:hypothetical protein